MLRIYLATGLSLLCGSPAVLAQQASGSAPVDFSRDVAPLLTGTCATCHLTGAEAGKMALVPKRAIASLVNVAAVSAPKLKRVVPGKPDESYLIMKLEGTHVKNGGTGSRMPFGAPPLSPERISLLRRWIAQGAKS